MQLELLETVEEMARAGAAAEYTDLTTYSCLRLSSRMIRRLIWKLANGR
jgi:hypothetical protein